MARPVKCGTCEILESDRSLMVKNEKGKYFHKGKCYEEHLEYREFLKKEKIEWDALYQYIVDLHKLLVVPKSIITRLQGLRNGEDLKRNKKYKMGAEYSLILEAYLLAEKDIKWAIANKLENKNDVRAINYCISIMIDKLNPAWRNRQKSKNAKVENKKLKKQIEEMTNIAQRVKSIQMNIVPEKSTDEVDITTLLD